MVLPPGVKRPVCQADHTLPSTAETKSEWSYTSTRPIRLQGMERDKIALLHQLVSTGSAITFVTWITDITSTARLCFLVQSFYPMINMKGRNTREIRNVRDYTLMKDIVVPTGTALCIY